MAPRKQARKTIKQLEKENKDLRHRLSSADHAIQLVASHHEAFKASAEAQFAVNQALFDERGKRIEELTRERDKLRAGLANGT